MEILRRCRNRSPVARLVVVGLLLSSAATGQSSSPSQHVVRTTKFTINGEADEHSAFYQKMFAMKEVNRYVDEGRLVEPFVGYSKEVRVGLLAYDDQEKVAKSPYPVTVIYAPDLDRVIKRLEQAGRPVSEFSAAGTDGYRLIVTRDPSENAIEIIERDGPPAIGGARIIVDDRQKAEEFFVQVFGVAPERRIETDDFDEVFMAFGGDLFLAIFEPKAAHPVVKSKYPVVAIYTTDYDAVLDRIKSIGLPYRQRGDRILFANDPSGNVIEIVRETSP